MPKELNLTISLLNCPFCNLDKYLELMAGINSSEDYISYRYFGHEIKESGVCHYKVHCHNCNASGGAGSSKLIAVNKWNKRN